MGAEENPVGKDIMISCIACKGSEFKIKQGATIQLVCTKCSNLSKVNGAQLNALDADEKEHTVLPVSQRKRPENVDPENEDVFEPRVNMKFRLTVPQFEVVNLAIQTIFENRLREFVIFNEDGKPKKLNYSKEFALEMICAELISDPNFKRPEYIPTGRKRPRLEWKQVKQEQHSVSTPVQEAQASQ